MFAAAKNLGDGTGGMSDLLKRLRAREKARHGLQVRLEKSPQKRVITILCGLLGRSL